MKRILPVLLLTFSGGSASAYAYDCEDAVSNYNSAVSEVDYTSKRYRSCVGSSQGSDDCWLEFRRLKRAHDDFETAVNDYRSECEA